VDNLEKPSLCIQKSESEEFMYTEIPLSDISVIKKDNGDNVKFGYSLKMGSALLLEKFLEVGFWTFKIGAWELAALNVVDYPFCISTIIF